jgi:preprotein translocase subunit SecY
MKSGGLSIVIEPGISFRLTTVITLTAGTVFMMWIGEQITEKGIGNGISLIIFAGIVANLPVALAQTLELSRTGDLQPLFVLMLIIMAIGVIGLIVFMERAQRRVTIQYAKRQVSGRVMVGGDNTHLPLKINSSGVIPPIFASSIILFPVTLANFFPSEISSAVVNNFSPGHVPYMAIYAIAITFFCFFYTAIVFNPDETAENLQKYNGYIPGIRPGKKTANYLESILLRLTLVGAIYIVLICLIPELLIASYSVPFYFGGTSLLIVVVVTMDTVSQVQSFLITRQYENLMRKTKIRSRRR